MTMTSTALRNYWVRLHGTLVDDDSNASPEENCGAFLDRLLIALGEDTAASNPGIMSVGGSKIFVSGVLRAATDGGAVDAAKAVFGAALERAGMPNATLPDQKHGAWH